MCRKHSLLLTEVKRKWDIKLISQYNKPNCDIIVTIACLYSFCVFRISLISFPQPYSPWFLSVPPTESYITPQLTLQCQKQGISSTNPSVFHWTSFPVSFICLPSSQPLSLRSISISQVHTFKKVSSPKFSVCSLSLPS